MIKIGKIDDPIDVGPMAMEKIREDAKSEYGEINKARSREMSVRISVQVSKGESSVVLHMPTTGDVDGFLKVLEETNILSKEDKDVETLTGGANIAFDADSIAISERILEKHRKRFIANVKAIRAEEGLEYALNPAHDVSMFKFSGPDFIIGIGVEKVTRFEYRVGVCFCTPQDFDKWMDKRARELLGYRIKNSPLFIFEFEKHIPSVLDIALRTMNKLVFMGSEGSPEIGLPSFFLKACAHHADWFADLHMERIPLAKEGTKAGRNRIPSTVADA